MEFQKCLPDDYFITTLQRLAMSRQKPAPAIYESTVGRAEVFDEKLAVLIHDSRVAPGDLGLGIVLIKIDVREYSAICVPSSDMSFGTGDWKLLTNSASAFYDQLGA